MGYGKDQYKWLKHLVILAVGIALLAVVFGNRGKQRAIPGIKDPIQTESSGQTEIIKEGYKITVSYLYEYDISALVVGTHNYPGFDIGDKLAPRDVALAWGSVAAYNSVIDFHWRQSGRWYFWSVDSYEEVDKVGGIDGVSMHSSNNHLIAADRTVEKAIKKIKTGDYIRLKGYLVNLDGKNGSGSTFTWHSSTSRMDSGAHSCEVIYVTGVEWLSR